MKYCLQYFVSFIPSFRKLNLMKMSYVGSIFLKLGATKTLWMTCFYPVFEYHLTNKKFKRKDFHHHVPGSISMIK